MYALNIYKALAEMIATDSDLGYVQSWSYEIFKKRRSARTNLLNKNN